MMDFYELIKLRKSVRAYQDQAVPEAVMTRILEAGRLAPSASNRQEWRFVVVQDAETRRKLVKVADDQEFVGQAPVVLVCCADTDEHVMMCGHYSYTIDLAIAIDHITLAAAAEGLGTCWIGAFHEDQARELLGIPHRIRVVALLPLGYPDDPTPVEKFRRPLQQIVKYEKWS
jgi:nitroreductase